MADPLRVLIDGHDLLLQTGTGIATYTRTLAAAVGRLGGQRSMLVERPPLRTNDAVMREIAFFDVATHAGRVGGFRQFLARLTELRRMFGAPIHGERLVRTGAVDTSTFDDSLDLFEELCHAPYIFRAARDHFARTGRRLRLKLDTPIDIAHWSGPLPIELVGARNVYTLHDLIPLKLPFLTLDNKRRYLKMMRHLAEVADRIVTVSENSRDDIVALTGCDPAKITVTYQPTDLMRGPGGRTVEIDRDDLKVRLKQLYNLDAGRYFLVTGTIESRKNIGRLLLAYLSVDTDMPLLIVGPNGYRADKELELLESRAITWRATRVRQLGYVSRSQLRDLIAGARALCFPTLYEGFGLPVLEAMTLGTPVMTSRNSSLPEVAGEAALYVDPYQPEEMRRAIARLAHDDALVARLRQLGTQQAARFSEADYDARLADMYQVVMSQGRGRAAP